MTRLLRSVALTSWPVGGATCLVVLLALLAVVPELHAQAPGPEHAIAVFKAKGGQVQRDLKAPGQPVIALGLRGTPVTDADLALLKHLPGLHTLNLTQTAITDAGLTHLTPLPQLRHLSLPVTITDAGLVHLKGLTQLEHLSLLDSQVSDAGLVHLQGLHHLKSLLLNGTKVTDAGLRNIRQALPRARIGR